MFGGAVQRCAHEIDPHGQRRPSAGLRIAEGMGIVESHPGNGDHIRIEAGKPGVTLIVGGAGLAGDIVAAQYLGLSARAAADYVPHHAGHQIGVLRGDHPGRDMRRLGLIGGEVFAVCAYPVGCGGFQHLAIDIFNVVDEVRVDAKAAIGEHGIT